VKHQSQGLKSYFLNVLITKTLSSFVALKTLPELSMQIPGAWNYYLFRTGVFDPSETILSVLQ